MGTLSFMFLVGRIIFGGYFILNGISHFKNIGSMAGYASSKGVPSPKLAVGGSGLLLLIGGLGVILGIYVYWALAALALFLIPVTFTMHRFWTISDPMQKMGEKINFQKNMALLGAILIISAIPTPWIYSAF
jgi:putative oxidoreductase